MASELRLNLRISANAENAARELNETQQRLGHLSSSARQASQSFSQAALGALNLSDALRAVASGLSVMALYQAAKNTIAQADAMTLLSAKVAIATRSLADHADAMNSLRQISLETGTSLEGNTTLFTRLNKAIESSGRSYQDTLSLTRTLSQAIRVSGASAGEASSLIIQLSQALNSGVLRGDEFNSVMENGGRVVDALVASTGKTRGELRKLAEDGKLSSEVVIKALQDQSAAIAADAAKIPLTVGAAMENVRTQWVSWLADVNRSAGATSGLASALGGLANNFTAIANATTIAVGGLLSYLAALGTQGILSYVAAQHAAAAALRTSQVAALQSAAAQTAAALDTTAAQVALLTSNRELVAADIAAASAALQSANARLAQAAADRAAALATVNLTQATAALAAAEAARVDKAAALASLAALGRQQAGISQSLAAATAAHASATTAAGAAQANLASATSLTTRAMTALRGALAFVAGINPFTAIITAIGAGATAAWLYRDSLVTVGESTVSVGNLAESTWLTIKNAAIDAIDDIGAQFPVLQNAASAAGNFIADVFVSAWRIIKDTAAILANTLIASFVAAGKAIGMVAAGVVEMWRQKFTHIADMASGLARGIGAALAGDLSFREFNAAFKRETLSASDVFKDIGGAVKEAFNTDYVSAMGKSVSALKDRIVDGAEGLRALDTLMASNAAHAAAKAATDKKAAEDKAEIDKKAQQAAEKAAKAEAGRREEIAKTIQQIQFETSLIGLSDKTRQRSIELAHALTKAKGSEVEAIKAALQHKWDEIDADQRRADMWEELVRQATALDKLHDDAAESARLATLAKELQVQGLSNEAIKQRIELEKELYNAREANPDLDPAQVDAYVKQRTEAEKTLADIIDAGSRKSANVMETAWKRAAENIQDGFAEMFEDMLNGDALKSFETFAENIRSTLHKAISQQLALDLQNLLTGKGGAGSLLQSALVFGAGIAVSLFGKSSAPRALSPAEIGNSPVIGTGAMHIADSFGRDAGYQFQSKTILEFNKSLQYLGDTIMNSAGRITDWIGNLGAKLASTSVVQQVAAFFKPVTSLISQATSFISNIYNNLTNLVTKGATALGQLVGATAAGTGAANAGSGAAANAGISAMQNIAGALTVIKFGFDLFQTWGNDNLTTHKKITNSLYAASDALLSAAAIFGNWYAAAAAGVLNVAGVISDVFENGFNSENIGRLIFGPLAGLFMKQRTPNAWMNTYNPGRGDYTYKPTDKAITATGNKSAYVGEMTPFGATFISTHELSLSTKEMVNAFGALLKTVKTVDINLYNTINRLDEKVGETGRTMAFYNHYLRGDRRVATKQDTSELNTGVMLLNRYNWIANVLNKSGTQVGEAINAWFDVITKKFIKQSRSNAIMVVGIVDSLAANLEDFMRFPLALVDLIGQSVKSVKQGGTPDSVMDEIMGVLNAFTLVEQGFAQMQLDVDSDRIVAFLANVNAIGYGVKDAGLNLLAYSLALQKINGTLAASGDALMDTVEAKFKALQKQGLDNAQLNAYFGSFGLFASLFAEAKVAFAESDLDNAASQIHNLAKASVEAAKNVIDHAIASEKLTHVSRQAAIATLVKSGKLEEATVAEAEYGVSIQTATQELLSAMGFVQQLGYITGKALGTMGVSAETWVAAAKNVVAVFGDINTAASSLDSIAKTFLSPVEYARMHADTANRAVANLRAVTPALASITEASVTQLLKSGDAMKKFIDDLAAGNGEAAKSTLEYINLLMQAKTAQQQLNDTLQSMISLASVSTGYRQSRLSDSQAQLASVQAQYLDALIALVSNGAPLADQLGVIDIALQALGDVAGKAGDQIRQAFGQIYASIDDKRYNLAYRITELQGGDTASLQQQRALSMLASASIDQQLQGIDLLQSAIEDRYSKETDSIQKAADAYKQIGQYVASLKLNQQLSPLSNEARLAEARSQYQTQLAAAQAGDLDALTGITQFADTYLQEAQAFYASSTQYADIFNSVSDALDGLVKPVDADEQIRQNTTAMVEELKSINAWLDQILQAQQAGEQQQLTQVGTDLQSASTIFDSQRAVLTALQAALEAGTLQPDDVQSIAAQRLDTFASLESLLAAGLIDSADRDVIGGMAVGITASVVEALNAGTLNPAQFDTIGSAASSMIDSLVNGITSGRFSSTDINALEGGLSAFMDGLGAALSAVGFSDQDKTKLGTSIAGLAVLIGDAVLSDDLTAAARADLAGAVGSGLTQLSGHLHDTLKMLDFSPVQLAVLAGGFGKAADNMYQTLQGLGFSAEQLAVLDNGFAQAAVNTYQTLQDMDFSPQQRATLWSGMSGFAATLETTLKTLPVPGDFAATLASGINTLGATLAGLISHADTSGLGGALSSATGTLQQTQIEWGMIQEIARLTSLGDNIMRDKSYTPGADDEIQRARANYFYDQAEALKQELKDTGLVKFAKGGIATEPAIFGEAGPEAAVPLPDGRRIPVVIDWKNVPNANIDNSTPIVAAIHAGIEANARGQAALKAELAATRDEINTLNRRLARLEVA
jgi:tape measure domain-containing protein